MSKSSERERARLNRVERTPSTDIRSGLTVGDHGEHIITADSDEAERIKAGIIFGDGEESRRIASGLTYGDPRDNASNDARTAEIVQHGNAILERENFDRGELAMRRETELLEQAAVAVYVAARDNWTDPALNAQAASFWQSMTTEQRGSLVVSGEVSEEDADALHGAVWPAVLHAQQEHDAALAVATGRVQKAQSLMRIREERGNPNDAAWQAHQERVFARAREQGVVLSDDSMGTIRWESEFRAAEIALAEDQRADAVAQFQVAVLQAPSTTVSEGLKVIGPDGQWVSTVEGGEVRVKPDYARAVSRVIGGRGDPANDREEDIKAGIRGATSAADDPSWRAAQSVAGELFSEADKARIATKLGER
jgi:hypothetical protein